MAVFYTVTFVENITIVAAYYWSTHHSVVEPLLADIGAEVSGLPDNPGGHQKPVDDCNKRPDKSIVTQTQGTLSNIVWALRERSEKDLMTFKNLQ